MPDYDDLEVTAYRGLRCRDCGSSVDEYGYCPRCEPAADRPCPDAEVCKTCPVAEEDDVCLLHERLARENEQRDITDERKGRMSESYQVIIGPYERGRGDPPSGGPWLIRCYTDDGEHVHSVEGGTSLGMGLRAIERAIERREEAAG